MPLAERKKELFPTLETSPFLFLFLAIKFSRFYPELIENEIKIVFITRKKLASPLLFPKKLTRREEKIVKINFELHTLFCQRFCWLNGNWNCVGKFSIIFCVIVSTINILYHVEFD